MTKTSRLLALLAASALLSVATPVLAEQLTLSATLSGAEEVPPNDSAAAGAVEASYDTDSNTLTFAVTYTGLSGEATAAHFHGPASAGENAPPVLPIDSALTSPISGSATLTDEQEADLLGGKWYFNVHTAQYPDGEIRGQVLQSAMSSESSMESSMMESSMSSSEMSSSSSSSSQPLSSTSSSLSSAVSSASSAVSSAVSSASSAVDPSVSVSVSASVEVSASVSVPAP